MAVPSPDIIRITGASENNLKQVSLEIKKKKITVFTGVSGSGKSSLCLDTIAAESRRELNETFPSFVQQYLPKYGRPEVEKIENLPVTIVIDQKKPAANTRSTVGTYTDIYALLRLLFSRVGKPFVGYSDSFSFNHPAGKCPRCDGLGMVTDLDIHKLVDFDKCLNDEDVIHFPTFTTGAWRWKRYAYSGLFDLDKKIRDYSPEELDAALVSANADLQDSTAKLKALDAAIREKKELQTQVLAYAKTKPARDGLKAQKTEKARSAYRERHESDFIIADAATRYFRAHGVSKLPSHKALQAEIERLTAEKNAHYNEYREKKARVKELHTVKSNLSQILQGEKDREKKHEHER